MRFKTTAIIILALILGGCGLFKTPEPSLLRLATYISDGAKFGEPFGLAYRKGELFVSDGEAGVIWKVSAKGEKTVHAGGLGTPSHIAFDDQGYLLVADSGTHTIKRIRAGGDVEVVAGIENKSGFADGNTNEALFRAPIGIAFSDGAIFVADTYNDRIRVIRNGQVSTLSGSKRGFADGAGLEALFDTPTGITVTKDKRILVADSGNSLIRAVDASGNVSTFAGSKLAPKDGDSEVSNRLFEPSSFAESENGDIYFTDGNSLRRVRKQDGAIETLSETERGYSDSAQSEPRRFNRPTGIAIGSSGELFVADSENQALRVFDGKQGKVFSQDEIRAAKQTPADFRAAAPPRWPFEPGNTRRDIAGTLGEIRGAIDKPEEGLYFHNGLDISGAYGEKAHFVRKEKVLRPISVGNFDTLREYLRMPTIGYVHIRLGRDQDGKSFGDPRFIFETATGDSKKPTSVRVPRGTVFNAGEAIGTLNPMNHVHLIAGRSGSEFNALEALDLPGASDSVEPIVVGATIKDQTGATLEPAILSQGSKVQAVVEAYDRMDGNPERRRLGAYKAGFQIFKDSQPLSQISWNIVFNGNPEESWVPLAYAPGSSSGATGTTVFRYIVTNRVSSTQAEKGFLPLDGLTPGKYILRVFVGDFFGNTSSKDVPFELK